MKILIVDDHPIVRAGLRNLLAGLPGAAVLEAEDGRAAYRLFQAEQPAVAIIDIRLPGVGGLELARRIRLHWREARMLVFSMYHEPIFATRALQAGALGYISKNAAPAAMLEAVKTVAAGRFYVQPDTARPAPDARETADPLERLGSRDIEILRLLGDGRSLVEIAESIGVSYKTAANLRTAIKGKLGVNRTSDLVRFAIERLDPRMQ